MTQTEKNLRSKKKIVSIIILFTLFGIFPFIQTAKSNGYPFTIIEVLGEDGVPLAPPGEGSNKCEVGELITVICTSSVPEIFVYWDSLLDGYIGQLELEEGYYKLSFEVPISEEGIHQIWVSDDIDYAYYVEVDVEPASGPHVGPWIVDDDGPADFQYIQDAIDAAEHGDIIHVMPGWYHMMDGAPPDIHINKGVKLLAPYGGATIGPGGAIYIEANNVEISGFGIKELDAPPHEGAITVPAQYKNIYIHDNSFNIENTYPCNIAVTGTDPPTETSIVIKNNLLGTKAALSLRLYGVSGLIISDNDFGLYYAHFEKSNIWMSHCEGNIVTENTFRKDSMPGNDDWAVYNENSDGDNLFYHNNFLDNEYFPIQYYFYGSNPTDKWDDGQPGGGNYYWDYPGSGSYDVDGVSQDIYPLTDPWVPTDNTPPTTTMDVSGNQVTLTATDNGVGVFSTWYSYDGYNWIKYEAPFTKEPGVYTIHYYSYDMTGNIEEINIEEITILEGVETSTGTGYASMEPTSGSITDVQALNEEDFPYMPPGIDFPDGLFSITIEGLTPGETITLGLTLPTPVEVGSLYWKFHNGVWDSLPIGSDDGDNYITITLTDGGTGDGDNTADGTIHDPGGPGFLSDTMPPEVSIIIPEEYGVYPVESGYTYSYIATDLDPNPAIITSLSDYTGVIDNPVNGDQLPSTPGVYEYTVGATDSSGNTASQTVLFVMYDPDGGFVTGGGWINSPEGAYVPDPTLSGTASFGFVSKYKKGATEPTGNTEFVFKTADMNFHSSSYDWLVIAGDKAKYKGTGTINGEGEYKFILTATDADVDLFRIKIWEEGDLIPIYDNKLGSDDDGYDGTEINGGNIVVHKAKK
jgi:hypothetical protein